MHEFDIESTAEVNGETLNKKPDIALGARERLKAVEGCCDVTWETHHTNYILHADWRLNSRAPRWGPRFLGGFVAVNPNLKFAEWCLILFFSFFFFGEKSL